MSDLETSPVTPEIPVLKKKEKEQKGAGFVWSGGASPAGSGFFGASSPGLLGSGRVAAFLGRALGGSSTAAGRLLLSKTGSFLVLGGAASTLGVGLVGGAWVMSQMFPSAQSSAFVAPVLDGVSDSIRIRRPGNTDPSVRSSAGARFDDGQLLAPKDPPADATSALTKAEAVAPMPALPQAPQDGLADQAKKAGLDLSKLGGLSSATGGGGGGAMPNLQKQTLPSNDFALKKEFMPASNFVKLKNLTPFENKHPLVSTKEGHQLAKSQRAMGQLKFTKDMSNAAAGAGTQEAGKTFSTDAFEQGRTTGGVVAGDSIVPPSGSGAPDLTKSVSNGVNVTPYQNQMDNGQQDSSMAAALKIAGIAAIAAGIAMIMAGLSMTPPNMGLIMAGIALVLAGIAMLIASSALGKKAKNQGNNIANQYGQQDQGNIVNNCASQAVDNGTQPQNCNAPFSMPTNNVHQSVTEESQSTYNLGQGGPIH